MGVKYWEHVPEIFDWPAHQDHVPCPLNLTYQLVRNVLAATRDPSSPQVGHAVLLYDSRNPAFRPGGLGAKAYEDTRKHLRDDRMLRKCSWQAVLTHMRDAELRPWVTREVERKYGL